MSTARPPRSRNDQVVAGPVGRQGTEVKNVGLSKVNIGLHLADGTQLKVLHPLDVLKSRLKNLAALPPKRDS